ncbi:MAG: hypothetical protein ACREOF_09300 [Gemmatimonadales bacterium]
MRSLLLLLLLAACGGGDRTPDASDADTDAAWGDAQRPAPNMHPAPIPSDPSSAPLTPDDIGRWEKGMQGELEAVQAAAAKMKSARTGEDSLSAMMGVQEMNTLEAGAKAAGVDLNRYRIIRSNLSEAVKHFTPPEMEGMDTTKMPEKLRAEFRTMRENQLEQLSAMVPEAVQKALEPRALELRKKNLALAEARIKGAGR